MTTQPSAQTQGGPTHPVPTTTQRIFNIRDYVKPPEEKAEHLLYGDPDISALVWWAEPGKSHLDIHSHPNSAHVYVILEGEGEALMGKGKWDKIHAGQVIINPRKKIHGIRNTSKDKRLVWVSCTVSQGGPYVATPGTEKDE